MIELEYIVSTKCDVYNIIIQLYTIQIYYTQCITSI